MSVIAKDASGNSVAVSTEVRGTVDSVDLTQNPPTLKIGGQSFTLDKIKQVVAGGHSKPPCPSGVCRTVRGTYMPSVGICFLFTGRA